MISLCRVILRVSFDAFLCYINANELVKAKDVISMSNSIFTDAGHTTSICRACGWEEEQKIGALAAF